MKQEFGYFLKNAKFRAALGLTLLLSYGYAIATTRVSIDSLEGDRYIGTGGVMLSTGLPNTKSFTDFKRFSKRLFFTFS